MKALTSSAVEKQPSISRSAWIGPTLLTGLSIVTWVLSLLAADIQDTSDLGLITALPWWTALGPLLLIAAFVWTLLYLPATSRVRTGLLIFQTIVLVAILFGTGPIIQPLTANHVAWRHVGIADAIQNNGIDSTVDAYFSWPGFFAMAAIAVEAVGPLETVKAVAWTPVVLNLLYTLPVFLLALWLFRSDIPAWTSVWIFVLGNWVGQDYFSPQGFAYLGYLVIVVLLATSVAEVPLAEAEPIGSDFSITEFIPSRPYAVAIIVVIYAWIVASHQLTPIAVLIVVGVLLIARRNIPWQLLVVMLLMQIGWLSFLAVDYLRGNLQVLVDQLGDLDQIAQSTISNRVGGSAAHLFVVKLRMATVAVLAVAGFLGWLKARRGVSTAQRRRLITVGLVGGAPFILLALGPYGGEVALRAYLFALPVLAVLTAALFTVRAPATPEGAQPRRGRWVAAGTGIALAVLLVMFPYTKYGNEDSLYFTPSELAVVEEFYDVAPPGSLVLSATPNVPWKWKSYTEYKYRTISQVSPLPSREDLEERIYELADSADVPAVYVLLTRSQGALNDSFGIWGVGAIEDLGARLITTGDFSVVFDTDDGILLQYVR
jgi:hypothetical protein